MKTTKGSKGGRETGKEREREREPLCHQKESGGDWAEEDRKKGRWKAAAWNG